MEKLTRVFTFEKETKNTVRYQEEPVEGVTAVGPLYVQKSVLGDTPPHQLSMTIENAQKI